MSNDKCSRAEALLAGGASMSEIATVLEVTRQRVRQMLAESRAARLRAASPDPFSRLSVRTANGLKAEFLYLRKQPLTVDTVARAYEQGRLRTVRNIGRKSVEEIGRWLAEVRGRPAESAHES